MVLSIPFAPEGLEFLSLPLLDFSSYLSGDENGEAEPEVLQVSPLS